MAGRASDEAIVAIDNVKWACVARLKNGSAVISGGVRLFRQAYEYALVEVMVVMVVAVPVGISERVAPTGVLQSMSQVVKNADSERPKAAPGIEGDAIRARCRVATVANGRLDVFPANRPRVIVCG